MCKAKRYDTNPANNLGIPPLQRYADLDLYSFSILHRAEPSIDCEAQNSTVFVIPSSPTFLPTSMFTFLVITFLAYGQQDSHSDFRGTT